MHNFKYGWGLIALTVSVSLYPIESSAAPPVNTVNNGPVISGGTYYNTSNSKTTFTNTSGGLWLKSGSNIRGVEVNSTGGLTNNGGAVHLFAPGQVVRLDGNIDVRGVRNSSGAYLGNGGKVFVDSAYLYQSGKIYASGNTGGLVQFNVGSATLTGNARIEAKGTGNGQGGIISINASGPVDIQRQVVLDTSGRVAGTFDTNVINIEGGLVNVEGTLKASGLVSETDGISTGGTIRLVSTGQSDLTQAHQALQKSVNGNIFTAQESTTINTRLNALKNLGDGDVAIAAATATASQANLETRGGFGLASGNDPFDATPRAGDGGTIIITAQRNIQNGGLINASGGQGTPYPLPEGGSQLSNGGNGGTISLNAGVGITNTGRVINDGGDAGLSVNQIDGFNGGTGGLSAFSYGNQMNNTGVVRANGGKGAYSFRTDGNGGNGGLVVLSGAANPSGNGYIITSGGLPGVRLGTGSSSGVAGKLGSIVAPNPVTATNILIGRWRHTGPLELLTHNENLILLGNRLPFDTDRTNELRNDFSAWTRYARVRSVADAQGEIYDDRGQALTEFGSKITASPEEFDTSPVFPYRNFIFSNSREQQILFFNPDQLTRGFVRRVLVDSYNTMTILHAGYLSYGSPTGGVRATQFGNGMGGGRFSLISANFGQIFPIYVNGGVAGGSLNLAAAGQLQTGGSLGPVLTKHLSTGGTFHGGSITLKAGRNLHAEARTHANGGIAGGNVQLISNDTLSNFRAIQANGGLSGGSILLQAKNSLSNYSVVSTRLEANGGNYGGYIKLKAPTFITAPTGYVPIQLQAIGSIQNGQIVQEP